jgi:uncharacterized protein
MHTQGDELLLSATDLSNFLGCRHCTALDIAVARGARDRPWFHDPLLEVLRRRGAEHEQRYVESLKSEGLSVSDISTVEDPAQRATATMGAMRSGADVIVQGALRDGLWLGRPDVMRRVDRPSALGQWSYEIADTKLARETRAGTILQLGLYSEMLRVAQGVSPEHFHVVTPDAIAPMQTYRVDDYAAYFRLVRERMLASVALGFERLGAENYPDPVQHCDVCRWDATCSKRRRADDHLSLVAGITRIQRRELEERAVTTLTSLATLPVPLPFSPARGSVETYVRVRDQARLQLASRDRTPPLHELLHVQPGDGLCRLPDPSPGDLFLDLEGDPLAVDGGREYLFGLASSDGSYRSAWALTPRAEREGFEWLIDTIEAAVREHPLLHVYHYAAYEPSALKRLMGRYATRERELDVMLREGRFVDLYAVVRQGIQAGVERYSIKNLEPLYDFHRGVRLSDANRSLSLVQYHLEMGTAESAPPEALRIVEGYNRDDCLSTLRLRDWLERLRSDAIAQGADIPRPGLASGDAPPAVDERAARVEALRARLLAGVPEAEAERDAAQRSRWLVSYLLDYHRREDKATWWEYYRLRDLPERELTDERDAVTGLEYVERVDVIRHSKTGRATGSVIDRYRYPPQEMDIERGSEVRLPDGSSFGKIVAVDRVARTVDVRKGRQAAEIHPRALIAFTHVPVDAIEDAVFRIAESIAGGDVGYRAARSLLAAARPRLRAGSLAPHEGETATDIAVRVAAELDDSVLAIQGPPGSGKTHCGARIICDLARQGKTIGISATSHNVIRKLLDDTSAFAAGLGMPIRLARKPGDGELDEPNGSGVRRIESNADALTALRSHEVDVLGGTAWMWARSEFAASVDALFVDEAGQMSLANVLAVSQAASSVVLLGDPRQLEQPRRGTHPDGVGVSALEHILAGHQTIPADKGILLPITWRLAPAICALTSELFYEGRLTSLDGLDRQRISGVDGLPASGLCLANIEHDGNGSSSPEEVEVVAALVARLTAAGVMWTDRNGREFQLRGSDILVVAPYNAQVGRLAERLDGTGARVGTVDKFQGQEAPVVIYSMAASRPEDAPRGMEFLYNLNRLNVATSRARCLAILVASPKLFDADCATPRQMQLANALCRFRELAIPLDGQR